MKTERAKAIKRTLTPERAAELHVAARTTQTIEEGRPNPYVFSSPQGATIKTGHESVRAALERYLRDVVRACYTRIRADGSVGMEEAFCAGPIQDNGFYGHGIVNAYAAVTEAISGVILAASLVMLR